MIKGTTPTLEFELPFEVALVKNAYVTLSQKGVIVINKQIKDCECQSNILSVKLTQEDTIRLNATDIVEIQIRVLTANDDALASEIWTTYAERILYEGIIS